jgi:L-asparagine oxygenase
MDTFEEIADRLKHQVHLDPGSLLVINNKKVLHSRSEFPANFDGNDRWLIRSYVSRNLGSVADDLCSGGRIVKPRF